MPGRPEPRDDAGPAYPVDDPRARRDGLGWVTRAIFSDHRLRLWAAPAGASAAWADDNAAPPGLGGGRPAVRYAVIPSLDRARFLLPLVSRRVTAASVLAYNALRPPKVRAGRAVIGTLARLGLLDLLRAPVLSVLVPGGVPGREVLLADHLAAVLGHDRLHAAIGIRPPDPHHKPTLQLFDDAGTPRGYAKVGWNDATRRMVRCEIAALRRLPRVGGDFPDGLPLICATRWHDREVAVIEPMPRAVRRVRRPGRPRPATLLAVARRGGPPAPSRPVRGSPFLTRLRVRSAGAGPTIRAAIDALEVRDGALVLEFGDWHGDWVPWNLARHRGRLLAWDWENSAPGVPIGFDLAHQAFQVALSTRRLSAAAASGAMDAALHRHGGELHLDVAQRRFVGDGYLVELWLRGYELAAGGGGWNPRLHPALLRLLTERLDLAEPAPPPAAG